MAEDKKKKATGYDKYVNWKLFIFPVILFALILMMPTPYGMKDVGMEYNVGPEAVVEFITYELYKTKSSDATQWQLLTAQMMERNIRMGALNVKRFLKRDLKWCKKYKIQADSKNLEKAQNYIKENVTAEAFEKVMMESLKLRRETLKYENLPARIKKRQIKALGISRCPLP